MSLSYTHAPAAAYKITGHFIAWSLALPSCQMILCATHSIWLSPPNSALLSNDLPCRDWAETTLQQASTSAHSTRPALPCVPARLPAPERGFPVHIPSY